MMMIIWIELPCGKGSSKHYKIYFFEISLFKDMKFNYFLEHNYVKKYLSIQRLNSYHIILILSCLD